MNYKKVILPAFAIFIAAIFLFAPIGAASHSISPATTSQTNYQPNPTMNTNVTWNTYYSGWSPLEYTVNSTSNATLNVNYSQFYENPISLNPTDLQSKDLQGDNISKSPVWDANVSSNWYGATGTVYGKTGNSIYLKATENATTTEGPHITYAIPITNLESNNLNYSYITVIYSLSGTFQTGVRGLIYIGNDTTAVPITYIQPGQTGYISISLAQIQKDDNISLSTLTQSKICIIPQINTPASSSGYTYNLTLTGLAMSMQSMTLGTEKSNNTISTPTSFKGTAMQLNTFSPNFPYTSVNKGAYSVAVSQPLQNLTQTQTPITTGNYIEQVGYQGHFELPSAPDLSYGATNISLPLSVPASQIQILDVNGVSYLSTLGNKTNGTVTLISTANPTSTNSYLAYVDYTASQWQDISHPAGIFTIDGIAYYFFIAIGVVAGLIGLGVAARRANNKAKQEEKVDHTIRRGR
jgi:hypothetical protein